MKTYFSVISDCIFALFITFVLSFIFLNYFIKRPFSIAFAFILAALFAMIFYRLSHKKYSTAKQLKKDEKQFNEVLSALNFSTPAENNALLIKALSKKGYLAEKKKGGVFLTKPPVAIFLFFGFTEVKKADIVKVFNTVNKNCTAYIVSPEFSPEIIDFASRFLGRIKTISAHDYYAFLKDTDTLPTPKIVFPEEKKGLALFSNLLEKRKAKRFLSFGCIFLLMALFLPLKLYYTVTGCAFLLYSLILFLFGKEKTQE